MLEAQQLHLRLSDVSKVDEISTERETTLCYRKALRYSNLMVQRVPFSSQRQFPRPILCITACLILSRAIQFAHLHTALFEVQQGWI